MRFSPAIRTAPQRPPKALVFGLAFLCEQSELRKVGPASSRVAARAVAYRKFKSLPGASLLLSAFGPRNGLPDHFVRAGAKRASPCSRHKILRADICTGLYLSSVTFFTMIGVTGSCVGIGPLPPPVGILPIASTTSMPDSTCPKTA